jgi:hypothetical protein
VESGIDLWKLVCYDTHPAHPEKNRMQDSNETTALSVETRTPRDKFTQKLTRICEKLDMCSHGLVPWKNDYFGKTGAVETVIEELWVFGSYARGATKCGDLDIIVKINNKALTYLIGRHVSRFFFGGPRDVNVYVGTPEENQSGLKIDDAVLVWKNSNSEWSSAIQGIKPNALAGRHPRYTDAFPIRPEQINLPFRHADIMLRAQHDQLIQWRFTPFPLTLAQNTKSEQAAINRIVKRCKISKRSTKLLPHLLRCFSDLNVDLKSEIDEINDKPVLGNVAILLGNQVSLSPALLDNKKVEAIAVVPHITARGPNGVWWIERGNSHPLRKT